MPFQNNNGGDLKTQVRVLQVEAATSGTDEDKYQALIVAHLLGIEMPHVIWASQPEYDTSNDAYGAALTKIEEARND
jgi:hypothetical protein